MNENKSIQDLKSITIIGKKSYNIENKLFFDTTKKYINFKEEVNINEENIIKEIDPHLLSFNFYEIFSNNVKKEKTFKLIINKKRKKFIQNIEDFLNSGKKFLWITGSDGIGKTVSLMLYSIISNDNVLYFNLKLFHKKYEKIKEFFANEVMKYIYFKTENKSEKMKIMQSNLSYIFNNVLDKSLKKMI